MEPELRELQLQLELQLRGIPPPLIVLDIFTAEYIQKRDKDSNPERRQELTAAARKEWFNMTPMAQREYQNQPHVMQILVENEEREMRNLELDREMQARLEEIHDDPQHMRMAETQRVQNEEIAQLKVEILMIAISLLLLCAYVFCSIALRLFKSSKNRHF